MKIWSQNLTQTNNSKFQNLEHRRARLFLAQTTAVEASAERVGLVIVLICKKNKLKPKGYLFKKKQIDIYIENKTYFQNTSVKITLGENRLANHFWNSLAKCKQKLHHRSKRWASSTVGHSPAKRSHGNSTKTKSYKRIKNSEAKSRSFV